MNERSQYFYLFTAEEPNFTAEEPNSALQLPLKNKKSRIRLFTSPNAARHKGCLSFFREYIIWLLYYIPSAEKGRATSQRCLRVTQRSQGPRRGGGAFPDIRDPLPPPQAN